MHNEDWRTRWASIGAERRRAILQAIQRGEPVTDLRDAPLAIEYIDRHLAKAGRLRRMWKWLSLKHLIPLAGVGVTLGLVSGDLKAAALSMVPLGLGLWAIPLRLHLQRFEARAIEARELNERLARPL